MLQQQGARPGDSAVTGAALFMPFASHAERIKDLATVAGVRGNQLIGYGLVVGRDGTGDQTSQTPFTIQALKNMLAQLGVLVPANVNPQLRNVAAVFDAYLNPDAYRRGELASFSMNA